MNGASVACDFRTVAYILMEITLRSLRIKIKTLISSLQVKICCKNIMTDR